MKIVLGLCSLLLAWASAAPAALAADRTLRFGVNTSLSGGAAPTGRGFLRALEVAADDINAAGGIKVGSDRYLIKLVVYDNKYDSREAVSVANKLIFNDRVRYLGTVGGTQAVAVNPLVTENKVLNFAYAYGGKKATYPGAPFTFRTIPEPAQSYAALMPWVVKKYGIKTLAITSTDDETGLVQAEDSEREAGRLGLKVVEKVFAPRGTTDFTPMLTKIIARNPDAIDFAAWAGTEGPTICKQARELGYKGLYIFSYAQSIPTFLKIAGDYTDGVLFFQIFASDPTPLATRFRQRYEERYKEPFDPIVWRNADVLYIFKRAVETSGSLDPAVLKDAVRKVKFDGVFGTTRVGGKSYYGIDAQFLFPMPLTTYDAKAKKLVELYRGEAPAGY